MESGRFLEIMRAMISRELMGREAGGLMPRRGNSR